MRTGSAIIRVILAGMVTICLANACRQLHREQKPTGVIEGVVIDSATGELIWNAAVLIKGTDRGASTGNSGHFWIKGVPAGSCDLVVSEIDHKTTEHTAVEVRAHDVTQVSIRMAERDRDMFNDPVVRGIEIKGNKYGEIEGEVWNTGNVQYAPIGGALVAVTGTSLAARADGLGRFQIKHVLPGSYHLIISQIPYEQTMVPIQVRPGVTERFRVELEETPTDLHHDPEIIDNPNQDYGCIKGEVVDSLTGWPVVGALVTTGRPGSGVLTDVKGRFVIKAVPTGHQYVYIIDIRYPDKNILKGIMVEANRTTKVKVQLAVVPPPQ
jgi:hypothetical protein